MRKERGNYLDMSVYKRKNHFDYFRSLAYPYVGVTVNVDITELLRKTKEKKLSFFLTVCYCVSQAANHIPEFRQRIVGSDIVEFERCQTSHTVALEDGTYCYCTLRSDMPLSEYIPYATKEQEDARQRRSISEESSDILDKFFISTLPWVSFNHLTQPVPMPADSNPRITWGKYFSEGERVKIPLAVLCHHALVDGLHIGAFYEELDQQIAQI